MRQQVVTGWGLAVVLGLLGGRGGGAGSADPPASVTTQTPPGVMPLQGKDKVRAAELKGQVDRLFRTGDFAGAAEPARQLRELRERKLGKGHWQTVEARLDEAMTRKSAGYRERDRKALADSYADNDRGVQLLKKGRFREAQPLLERALATRRRLLNEEHPATATSYNNLAYTLSAQGKYAEAEAGYRKALALHKKLLGEEHPATATSYGNLALTLNEQGKYAEAEASLRKALALSRKLLGEEHLDTATSYSGLAYNLNAQGRYAEAEAGFRKALALRQKLLGEEHPTTANSYNNLASTLDSQGKYAEAEAGYRKALALRQKLLGEEHPATAQSYNNLAYTLNAQGKYAEAEVGFRKALALNKKLLGEEHPNTAISYNNLATNLSRQGKYVEAEADFRKALALNKKLVGEEHPHTATSYNDLASNLSRQGKYAEAEAGFRKALALTRKRLGEEHPATATSYNNLAYTLNVQGKYAEAEAGYRKALALRQKLLGQEHPHTAAGYNNLALTLNEQGRYAEAEKEWGRAAASFRTARLRITHAALDRAAKTGEDSPLPALAAVLARNGKPQDAWQCFEQSLARSTWDALAARLRRAPADQQHLDHLLSSLERLDRQIAATSARSTSTVADKQRREALLTQQHKALDELAALRRELEKKGGVAEGVSLPLAQIQKALPPDAALVGWLDQGVSPHARDPGGEHWGVVVRSKGAAVWVRLKGSGPGGRWTEADSALPRQLRRALASPAEDCQRLVGQVRRQRLDPLAQHLRAAGDVPAVRRLLVLPSAAVDGVPVELLAEGLTVSYTPSGTILAHLRGRPRPSSVGLLALADPVFDRPRPGPEPPLPPHGLLVTFLSPQSNAARAGLRPGDVLLAYDGADLHQRADLKIRPPGTDADARVEVLIWRAGRSLKRRLRPGKLGVVVADAPAPKALAESRRLLAVRRGGDDELAELPGTRVEAAWLARLFETREEQVTLLLDADASEQKLHALAAAGELKKYRYLHLATHGEMDGRFPLHSALRLSRDALPDPAKQLMAGKPLFDSRLTAAEVLRDWKLDADLVTLSACQSGLGKYERGEGFVGFAQALLLVGARSVCLSLWKVDDGATALLMGRCYQNLLGQRGGLKGPMAKAEALAEAKQWLRTLTRAEALKLAGQYSGDVERGKGRKQGPLLPPLPPGGAGKDRPYAHPYYWAAFVLIGDPE